MESRDGRARTMGVRGKTSGSSPDNLKVEGLWGSRSPKARYPRARDWPVLRERPACPAVPLRVRHGPVRFKA